MSPCHWGSMADLFLFARQILIPLLLKCDKQVRRHKKWLLPGDDNTPITTISPGPGIVSHYHHCYCRTVLSRQEAAHRTLVSTELNLSSWIFEIGLGDVSGLFYIGLIRHSSACSTSLRCHIWGGQLQVKIKSIIKAFWLLEWNYIFTSASPSASLVAVHSGLLFRITELATSKRLSRAQPRSPFQTFQSIDHHTTIRGPNLSNINIEFSFDFRYV